MLKLYVRPVSILGPTEEEAMLSLLLKGRREKVKMLKGQKDRSRSIAAGLLLRHMLLEEQISYEPTGVDVEQENRFLQEERNQKLAKRILTETEWNYWKDSRYDSYELLRFWTRKESYVKMTGEGMTKAFSAVDTLCEKYYKELPLGTLKDRYLISVCTQEDRTCDFQWKMLD